MALGRRFPPDVPKLAGRKWEGDGDKVVQRILEELVDSVQGLPMKHSTTHTGGDDDVAGTTDPISVAIANVADPGSATLGFAPIDHVHELDSAILATLEDVGDYVLSGQDMLLVYDPINYQLLDQVIRELQKLIYGNSLPPS